MINLDFSTYVLDRTRDFTGREWVFQAVNDWLDDPAGERFFLLTGEPGCGKTAIASRLCQFSQGIVPPPDGLQHLTQGFLSAIHFCLARDALWIDPLVFAGALATQLANRYPAYRRALANLQEDRQVQVDVRQKVQEVVNGQVIGVVINVSAPSPESAFNRVVREPLEVLFRAGFDQQVIILVDALDEALSSSLVPNIVSLLSQIDKLAPFVRFLLTTSQEAGVENDLRSVRELSLSTTDDRRNLEDVHEYVQVRLRNDLALAERAVQLELAQVNTLVQAVGRKSGGNFLYVRFLLDAMGQGLRSLTELEGLPEGLDGLYFDSLDRVVKLGKRDWFTEYRPLMGVLSVAQESLTLAQLQAFTAQPESSIWQYLSDLQQFIQEVEPKGNQGEKTYRLYHQSLADFLHKPWLSIERKQRPNKFYLPAKEFHKKLADGCGRGDLAAIWQDVHLDSVEQARRVYARQFYIVHLYRAQEWQRLFAVLDAGSYGQAKIRHEPSMRSFASDLDLGRQAAAWEGWPLNKGLALLPQLWQYTLLRCSLASRADDYPQEAFELLFLLGREPEVMGLVELLTRPQRKVELLLSIAKRMAVQPGREQERLDFLLRAWEIGRALELSATSSQMLRELLKALALAQQWERAEAVVREIDDRKSYFKAEALRELGAAFAQAQQWERAESIWGEAETLIRTFEKDWTKANALRELGAAMAQAQQWERAEAVIRSISEGDSLDTIRKVEMLYELGAAFAQAQQWERAVALWTEAEALADTILLRPERAEALIKLKISLAQSRTQEGAEALWAEAEALVRTIGLSMVKTRALRELGTAYARARQWERAKSAVLRIKELNQRIQALQELGVLLARAQQWEYANAMWVEVEDAVRKLAEAAGYSRLSTSWFTGQAAFALSKLGAVLAQVRQWERAEAVWAEAERLARTIKHNYGRAQALCQLGIAQAEAQRWEPARALCAEAEATVHTVKQSDGHAQALSGLGFAFIRAQQWERAEAVLRTIEVSDSRNSLCSRLAFVFIREQQWERAEVVIRMIDDDKWQASELRELVAALVQGQLWGHAEVLARTIQQGETRVFVLSKLGVALAQAQQWERAEALWAEAEALVRSTSQIELRSFLLSRFGLTLARVQRWERAEAIIRTIEQHEKRIEALCELAMQLAWAQQWEHASALWAETEMAACLIEQSEKRAEVLCAMAISAARAQQWERAEALVDLIGQSEKRVKALCEMAMSLTRAQQREHAEAIWDEVEAVARAIGHGEKRAKALQELAQAFIWTQRWERAEAVLQKIEVSGSRNRLWRTLGSSLAEQQQWERAEAVISMIDSRTERNEALQDLGQALARAQQWERAEALAHSMGYSDERAWILHALCVALAKAQQWERAEATAYTIQKSDLRAMALEDLAEALARAQQWERAEAIIHRPECISCELAVSRELVRVMNSLGKQEQTLRLVQRRWLYAASTREYAFDLLSLADGLIPLKPEIGNAFYEAFTWVDNFLKT